jgi:cellulose synthase/poly-beta-1,6-N-acetylglucosamine synthase-like glycosyltransferase
VAFIDADTIASEQWLNNIQKTFASFDRPVGVTGPTLTYEGGKLDRLAYKIATEWIQKLSLLMGIPHVAGFNCAYLKKPFLKCGGFDEDKRLSEDLVLSLKMRREGRIIYNKNVLAYTSLRRVKHYGYPYLLTFYLINDIFFFLSNRTLNYHPIR